MAQIGECVRRVLLLRLRGVTLVVCLVWRLFAVVEEHHSLRPRNAAAMLGVTLPARKPGSRHCSSSDKNDRPEPTQIWASRRRRPPPMTTRRPVAILAAAVAAGAAAVAHGSVIGVAPADMARYAGASGTFTCADGSATVPLDHVNDDYCDCHDGSDEPGTSACSAGRFYCENRGYFGAHIFSSRVRDGLCDCCDGSDEATHPTQRCPNTCASLAAAALKDYESKEAGLRAALEQKRAWVDASREGATKDQTELVELESSLEQLSTELSNVTARLDVLEEAERARKAAEEARRKEEEEARRQEEEARRAAEQPEGELAEHDAAQPDEGGAAEGGDGAAAGSGDTARAEPPADGAGPDSAAEGGAGPTADAAADTAADDGTAADGGEESWRQSWMRVDPSEDDRPSADGAAGAAADQPAAGAGEGEGGGGGEGEGEGDYMPAYDDEEDYVPPEYEGDDDYMPPEYDDDDVPSPHEGDDYPAEYDDDEYGGQYEGDDDLGAGDDDLGAGDDEAERDAYAGDDDYFSPEPEDDDDDYDPYADDEGADDLDEDDGAPTELQGVRAESRRLNERKRELERRINEIKARASMDYGPHSEFRHAHGTCLAVDAGEYVYELCPFDKVAQKQGSRVIAELGKWAADSWEGAEYRRMLYKGGQRCWSGPERQTTVTVECGATAAVHSVSEPEMCKYAMTFSTPAACSDADLSSASETLRSLRASAAAAGAAVGTKDEL